MKRLLLAWAVTAVAATGAGVAVLGLLGTGVSGTSTRVISQQEARAALATSTPRVAAASPTPTTRESAPAPRRRLRSAGGTVVASCDGDHVTLHSWSPAQGYSVDGVEPGPASTATVEFEPDADAGTDVELAITCSAGQPVARRQ